MLKIVVLIIMMFGSVNLSADGQVGWSAKHYKMICTKQTTTLEILVDEALDDGWRLYGSPICSRDGDNVEYCQAMWKN